MTDLKIINGRAHSVGHAPIAWYRIRKSLEGRVSMLKDGTVSFVNSQSNIDLWKSVFADCQVTSDDFEQFEDFVEREPRPEFSFKTTPYAHQIKGFEKLKDLSYFALLAQMGCGKSKILSDILAYKYCKGEIDAAVILSPKGVHFQWVEEQIPTHMAVPFAAWAWQNKKKEIERLQSEILPSNDLKILTANIDAIKTKEGYETIESFISANKGRVHFAVDEAHNLKNPSAQRSKIAFALGQKCKSRSILTGSPIAKNIEDVFGEYKFLDPNIIGTKYISSFRSNYCVQKNNGFGMTTVGAKNLEQLYAKIDPVSFRATKDELDLPPKVYDKRQFEMSPEQKRAYNDLKKTFMLQLEDDKTLTVANAASAMVKLQQITSGWVQYEDGSSTELPNTRLDTLLDVLQEIDGPVIIWARFNRDIQNIMAALKKDAVSYYGATTTEEREDAKTGFLSGKYRYFVSNPAAGGTGLNLQGECVHAVYYTNSFDAVHRWQSEDRNHRIGTKSTCTYIDLVCRGTIDNRILANLRDKKSLSDLAIDDIRRMMEE